MRYAFLYHGQDATDTKHFTIISDDEAGLRQVGVDICYNHYTVNAQGEFKSISYMEIGNCPKTGKYPPRPTRRQAYNAWEQVSRFFHPMLPFGGIPIIVGSGTFFHRCGGWTTFTGDKLYCVEPRLTEERKIYFLAWDHYNESCAESSEEVVVTFDDYKRLVPIHEAMRICEISQFSHIREKWTAIWKEISA